MDEAERLEEEVYLNAGKVFALQEDLRHLQNQVENIQEDTPETQVRALEERVTRTIAQVQQSAEHVRKSQERLEQIGVGPVKIIEDRMRNVNLGSSPTNTTSPARPVPAPRKSLQQKVAEEHNRRKSPGNSRRQSRTNSRTNLAASPEREEEGFDRNLAYRSSITKRGGESGLKWELAQEAEKEPEETDRPKRLADVRRWRAKNQRADTSPVNRRKVEEGDEGFDNGNLDYPDEGEMVEDESDNGNDSSEPLSRLKSDGLTSPSVRERAAVWDQHWRQESDKQRLKNDSMRVLSQWEVERERKRQEWSPTRLTSPTSPGWSRESSVSPGRTRDWSRESPSTPGHRFDWSRGNPTSPGSQRDWSRESSTSPGNRPGPTASENRPVYYSRRVLGRRGMVTSL
ncbi:PREDICTED: splicing regulatory glutamine/lysine-rich protein 1-like [Branchiostoma belcheri]|uniref:Splicing regulatory glutamine/lysine-rich protein 1-like n=1 Tax=Branchiostoma belcheri TaxID=7741 RepID=A0A6P4XLW3_BRABE|nr:PREDICTED: splicing regulatory glutamine/lysine-rich protein 1-like [Branchiostoma belcheri]